MKNTKLKIFITFFLCLVYINTISAMEQDTEESEKQLTTSSSSTFVQNARRRVGSLRRRIQIGTITPDSSTITGMSSENIMRMYAPIPYNIHHLRDAKKFIKRWGGCPDEHGRNYLSHALDLTIPWLFESPRKEQVYQRYNSEEALGDPEKLMSFSPIKEEENKEKNIEYIPLPGIKYWQKRYKLIALLLSQPTSTSMIKMRDRNDKTPLDHFVSSLIQIKEKEHIEQTDDCKKEKSEEERKKEIKKKESEKQGRKKYLPRIFNLIATQHADLLCNVLFKNNIPDKDRPVIKHMLSHFPIYLENVREARQYLKKLNRKKKKSINKQDRLRRTWAHYILCLTNKSILRNYTLKKHYRIIKNLIHAKPNLSIKDTKNRTPLSELFNSMLAMQYRLNLQTPKTPRPSKSQKQVSPQDEILHILLKIYKELVAHGYSNQLRDTFRRFATEERQQLQSLLSVFPIFDFKHVILQSISQLTNERKITKKSQPLVSVDPVNGQTFLHILANIKNKNTLLRHTEMRRYILIDALLVNMSRMIIVRDNQQKIPLQIFLESLPSFTECRINDNRQRALRYTALLLAIDTLIKNREEYLRALRETNLSHLLQLFNIQTAPAKTVIIEHTTDQHYIMEKTFLTDIPLNILIASLPLLNNLQMKSERNKNRQEQYKKIFVDLILQSASHDANYLQSIEQSSPDNLRLLQTILLTTYQSEGKRNHIWIDLINSIETIFHTSST